MEKRLVLFFVVSFSILMAYQGLMAWMYPPKAKPPAQQVAQADGQPADPAKADAPAEPGEAKAESDSAPAEATPGEPAPTEGEPAEAAANDAAGEIKPQEPGRRVTLGSADEASPYRMLVTLNSAGATVERVELNSATTVNQEDRIGYLGHVCAVDNGDQQGAVITVVGPGTPAHKAGLQAGDVITSYNKQPIPDALALEKTARQTEPRQEVEVVFQREGQERTVNVVLSRRPMEVISPNDMEELLKYWEQIGPDLLAPDPLNQPSFRLTLEQLGDRRLGEAGGELRGIDLESGVWEILPGASDSKIEFRKEVADAGVEVVKRYELAQVEPAGSAPAFHLNLTVEVRNTGDAARKLAYRLYGPEGLPTEGWWYATKINRSGWGGAGPRDIAIGAIENGKVVPSIITAATVASEEGIQPRRGSQIGYLGVDAQYFAAVMLPQTPQTENPTNNWIYEWQPVALGAIPKGDKARLANVSFRLTSQVEELAPGAALTHTYKVFAGPKQSAVVEQYGLGSLIYYGWPIFGWVSRPMSALLHAFYYVVRNYGVAIILLTVLVRSCMMPLSRKQVQSAQKMQELQPELKKLQEKYKNDMEARSKAQRELFVKHNYNPLGGCVLMFVQLPIFLGLYRALSVNFELRGAPLLWDGAWCSNLAAPDMLYRWMSIIPGFLLNWLGPYFNVFPVITIVLFIWQQKMFMPPATDEQTRMQQKMMQYMMVFIGVMFFKVPSGLCLYFIASSLWGLAERKLMPKPGPKPDEFEASPRDKQTSKLAAATNGNGRGNGKKREREKRR